MFLNFVFKLAFSFNVYATTDGISVSDYTDGVPCKEALTESLENSIEESEYILDQFLELGLDKATEIKEAVDAYFSVRNPLMGSNYSDEEKLLAIYVVKVLEGNVNGAAKLLDMTTQSLRRWTIDYEQRTGTQIHRTYYTEELNKVQAVQRATEVGAPEVAREFKVSVPSIHNWAKKLGIEIKKIRETKTYTEEFKTEVVQRATEVGVTETAKEFKVSVSSIYDWANKLGVEIKKYALEGDKVSEIKEAVDAYFSIRNPLMGSSYSDEEKLLAIEVVKVMEGNVNGAVKLLDMSQHSLRSWTIDYEQRTGTQIRNIGTYRSYTEEEKTKAVERAAEVGVTEAAREFKVSIPSIYDWANKLGIEIKKIRETKTYTEEFKTEVVQRATEVGVTETAKEFKVSVSSIYDWANKLGVEIKKYALEGDKVSEIKRAVDLYFSVRNPLMGSSYSDEEKLLAIYVVKVLEGSVNEAVKLLDMTAPSLRSWTIDYEQRTGTQIRNTGTYRSYTEEEKTKAVERAAEVGATEAAREFDVSVRSIRRWAKKLGVEIKKYALEGDKVSEIKEAVDAYFSIRNPLMGSSYSDEEKLLAIEVVKVMEGNVNGAAKLLDMTTVSLRSWTIDYEQRIGTQIRNTDTYRSYTEEEKTKAVERAAEVGATEAAREFDVSVGSIPKWAKKLGIEIKKIRETKTYTEEEKTKAVQRAKEVGATEAAKESGVSIGNVYRWAEELGVEIKKILKKYTEEEKTKAVQRATEVGAPEASKEFDVPASNIYYWANKLGVEIKKYTEEKTKVIERAKR